MWIVFWHNGYGYERKDFKTEQAAMDYISEGVGYCLELSDFTLIKGEEIPLTERPSRIRRASWAERWIKRAFG